MTISEKQSLEAASQTEGILETPKALLEASQQVIELETMLSKKAEEHAELREKFCTVEEELARIRERTQESVHELELERQEKDELLALSDDCRTQHFGSWWRIFQWKIL